MDGGPPGIAEDIVIDQHPCSPGAPVYKAFTRRDEVKLIEERERTGVKAGFGAIETVMANAGHVRFTQNLNHHVLLPISDRRSCAALSCSLLKMPELPFIL